ncbi:twin-arginine translocase TatA/TatE family subunit [Deinococcus cavernae]|uniref:Sec-independent protein translocase protein TatA n=1 Tax=Deinococcus cavernae TaxID=2320857 RepID=A0A418VGI8_9DEIO|nr:twin-arginine translocase TatA/TatE family subunit [Deinococcus cavernae]RJF75236.1 twin-arginine translocase TatA/TatE family subunit [Deinococcus cavernae]
MPFGPLEIILLLVVVVFIFGAGKLPQMMKGLGQGVREFKREAHESPAPAPLSSQVVPPKPEVPSASPVTERR